MAKETQPLAQIDGVPFWAVYKDGVRYFAHSSADLLFEHLDECIQSASRMYTWRGAVERMAVRQLEQAVRHAQ